ncbi:MAG: hypothetical protein MJ142_07725 [Clostridia bacterium]|nr:hypothetical protein [Clostridia bacterium]
MKKILSVIMIVCMIALLCSCSSTDKGSTASAGPASIGFKDAVSLESLLKLDGKQVTIVGYMATLSPVSGKYIYLMNMPYQSCPFCVPNTSQLANTMAVYAKSGDKFTYTDQAVRITGTLKFGENTDDFGYQYNYRIIDAAAEEIDLSTLGNEYKLWQSIASDGIVGDLSAMFDYLHFVCQWSQYQSSYIDENGNEVTYRLYSGDARQILESDGLYGYADKCNDTYFPSLVTRIRTISPDGLEDLVTIVQDAEKVANEAISDLYNEKCHWDQEADVYIQDRETELYDMWNEVYLRFSTWLAKWEV